MQALQINDEWICLAVETEGELATALQLAVDLRGQPKRWAANEAGVVLVAQATLRAKQDTVLFMTNPNCQDLVSIIWESLSLERGITVEVNIPRRPYMGGLVGWSMFQLFMWQAHVICSVVVPTEQPVATAVSRETP